MDKQNEMTELTPEQMGRVSGGTGVAPNPGPPPFIDDVFDPFGMSQGASSQGSSAPVTQTVSTPAAETNCDAGNAFRKLNRSKTSGYGAYVFEEYDTPV